MKWFTAWNQTGKFKTTGIQSFNNLRIINSLMLACLWFHIILIQCLESEINWNKASNELIRKFRRQQSASGINRSIQFPNIELADWFQEWMKWIINCWVWLMPPQLQFNSILNSANELIQIDWRHSIKLIN